MLPGSIISKIKLEKAVPCIATECSLVQRIEAVAVGEGHVRAVLQQQRHHVVALLRDGVVQRRVALAVLKQTCTSETGSQIPAPAAGTTTASENYRAEPISYIATIF